MKGMTRKALQMLFVFGVLAQPVTAEEPTTVESLLPVDFPPATDTAQSTEDAAPASLPAPDTLPAFRLLQHLWLQLLPMLRSGWCCRLRERLGSG